MIISLEVICYLLLLLASFELLPNIGIERHTVVAIIMSVITLYSWNRRSVIPAFKMVSLGSLISMLALGLIPLMSSVSIPIFVFLCVDGFVLVVFLVTVATDITTMVGSKPLAE
ncbi:MAG: hypothetical protein HQ472_05180 [Ignavibacteria bacterium]|nr:hypothetical protein [Ignavibacteria bacterium]